MRIGAQLAIMPRKTSHDVFRHNTEAMTPRSPEMKQSGLISQVKVKKREGFQEELIAENLRNAMDELDKITGKRDKEEIIESIFEDFCIGK